MAYKAGNLEVELLGIDNNVVVSINNTAKALSALSRAIDKINGSQFVLAGQKLEHIFTKIASATKSIDTTNLTALASAGKSLSAISKIGNLEKVDFAKVGKGFENLSVAITPFLEKVKSAEASLTALYGTLSKASGKKIQGLLDEDSGTPKGKKGGAFSFLNLAKWSAVIYAGRRLGRTLNNIVQSGADFSETLNLWQVSMGNKFLPQATEFVNKLSEAYGISKKTLMNSQAIFKNMLGSLGQISDTMAYSLSEGITQMALDYASLYNVKLEDAMTKFQAVLAGQVRPIRSVSGYDITENTLYEIYKSLGGTKTMRQLSRTEKQLLSIYAVFNQMDRSGAVGDFANTLGSFSNQSKIASDNIRDIMTYSGLIFTRWVQSTKLFQQLNGVLIFISDVLEAVANTLPDIEVPEDPLANILNSAEKTNEEIDKITGKLLDFDKFRALSPSAEENSTLGLDDTLIKAFSSYENVLDRVDDTTKKIVENLKIASGLFDESGVFNTEKWEEIEKKIKTVGLLLGSLFSGILLANIVKFFISPLGVASIAISSLIFGITELVSAWEKLSTMGKIIPILSGILAGILGIVVGLKALSLTVPGALALGATLAGGILALQTSLIVDNYANGGLPDKGTLFRAGEAGAEIVYNTPSGQSGVVNIQQIEQAMYGALVRYGKTQGENGQPIVVYLDGEKVYQNTTAHAKRRGNVWGKA